MNAHLYSFFLLSFSCSAHLILFRTLNKCKGIIKILDGTSPVYSCLDAPVQTHPGDGWGGEREREVEKGKGKGKKDTEMERDGASGSNKEKQKEKQKEKKEKERKEGNGEGDSTRLDSGEKKEEGLCEILVDGGMDEAANRQRLFKYVSASVDLSYKTCVTISLSGFFSFIHFLFFFVFSQNLYRPVSDALLRHLYVHTHVDTCPDNTHDGSAAPAPSLPPDLAPTLPQPETLTAPAPVLVRGASLTTAAPAPAPAPTPAPAPGLSLSPSAHPHPPGGPGTLTSLSLSPVVIDSACPAAAQARQEVGDERWYLPMEHVRELWFGSV